MSTGALQGDGSVIGDRIYGDSGDDTFIFKAPMEQMLTNYLSTEKGHKSMVAVIQIWSIILILVKNQSSIDR